MNSTVIQNFKDVPLSTQNFLLEMIVKSENEADHLLKIKDAIDAYTENLTIVESDIDDGVSVKAKDGTLIVELPKRTKQEVNK